MPDPRVRSEYASWHGRGFPQKRCIGSVLVQVCGVEGGLDPSGKDKSNHAWAQKIVTDFWGSGKRPHHVPRGYALARALGCLTVFWQSWAPTRALATQRP